MFFQASQNLFGGAETYLKRFLSGIQNYFQGSESLSSQIFLSPVVFLRYSTVRNYSNTFVVLTVWQLLTVWRMLKVSYNQCSYLFEGNCGYWTIPKWLFRRNFKPFFVIVHYHIDDRKLVLWPSNLTLMAITSLFCNWLLLFFCTYWPSPWLFGFLGLPFLFIFFNFKCFFYTNTFLYFSFPYHWSYLTRTIFL